MLAGVGLVGSGFGRPNTTVGTPVDPSLIFSYDFTQATLAAATENGNTPVFDRASDASSHNSSGTLVTAASDVVRLGSHYYTGSAWANAGYIGEGARTNIQRFSNALDTANAGWVSAFRLTQTINSTDITAPDGTNTTTKILETTDTNTHHYQGNGHTVVAGNDVAYSLFLQGLNRSHVAIDIFGSGMAAEVLYDLVAKNVEATNGVDLVSAQVEEIGPDMIRARLVANDAAVVSVRFDIYTNEDGTTILENYTGNTSDGFYGWGGQIEDDASFASSFIFTGASAVARVADDLRAGLTETPKTYFWDLRTAPGLSGDQVAGEAHVGTENSRVRVVRDSAGALRFIVTSAMTEVANLNLGTPGNNANVKVAGTIDDTGYKAIMTGGIEQTAGAGTAPSGLSTLDFCQDISGNQWFGHCKAAQGWNEVKDSAFIAALVA